jgi:PAS domain S-box-containing protein
MRKISTAEKRLLKEIHQLGIGLKSHPVAGEHSEEHNKSIELFTQAMCVTNDALWDWNLETDQVYCSPGLKSMFGYGDEELENKAGTWLGLVHSDDKQTLLKETRDFLAGRSDSFEVELRMHHKSGADVYVRSRAFLVNLDAVGKPTHMTGTHVDITEQKKQESYEEKSTEILKMIAIGNPASEIYDAIALMYEGRHVGMRCSMLELHDNLLMHGGAPSLPEEYCDAVNGLEYGPEVGSCGTSTYTGERVLVEDIATDPKWANLKQYALPHNLQSCWSEPIKNSGGQVLGAFGMYHPCPKLPNDIESGDLKSASRLAGIVMERDQAHKRIRELAFTDDLTGLGSRAHFYQNIEVLIKKCKHKKSRFWLLYMWMDEDKFHTAEVVPLYINNYRPTPAVGAVRDYSLRRLAYQSASDDLMLGYSGGHMTIDRPDANRTLDGNREQQLQQVSVPTNRVAKPLQWNQQAVALDIQEEGVSYRVGRDLWAYGDFETEDLYGLKAHNWHFSNSASGIAQGTALDTYAMQLVKGEGESLTSFGQKYFLRVWDENPKSLVLSVNSESAVQAQLCLEMRDYDTGTNDARANPEVRCLERQNVQANNWQQLVFDFEPPPQDYRGLRFRLDFYSDAEEQEVISVDDILFASWGEWGVSNQSGQEILNQPNQYNLLEFSDPENSNCCQLQYSTY